MADQIMIETLEAADGAELYCEVLVSPKPKGVIIAIHDYGKHAGVLRSPSLQWSRHGYSVYALDLRAHGRSPGSRGLIKKFDDFLEDLDLLLARVRDREGESPLFLLGQGVGALIAAKFAFSRTPNLVGLILQDLILAGPLSLLQKSLLRFNSSWLPCKDLATPINKFLLSPVPTDNSDLDDLAFKGPLPAHSVREIIGASREVQGQSPHLSCAVLSIFAESTEKGRSDLVVTLIEQIVAADKIHRSYFSTEQGQEQLVGDILAWCDERIETASNLMSEADIDEEAEND